MENEVDAERRTMEPGSLGELLVHLAPSLATRSPAPSWPPDAFAIVACVLHRTGGYRRAIHGWPPKEMPMGICFGPVAADEWAPRIEEIGRRWRVSGPSTAPPEVDAWWQRVWDHADLHLGDVPANDSLCHALLQILAAADSACEDVGSSLKMAISEIRRRPSSTGGESDSKQGGAGSEEDAGASSLDEQEYDSNVRFLIRAAGQLETSTQSDSGATLCSTAIDPWKARVLPKYHTPQTGITLRSFSHNIALGLAGEVVPRWFGVRRRRSGSESRPADQHPRLFNILVVPWPERIERAQFPPLHGLDLLENMPPGFGFFGFEKRSEPEAISARLARIYARAEKEAGRIDLVVLPELALDVSEYRAVRQWAHREQVFLVAGVGAAGESTLDAHGNTKATLGRNVVRFEIPWFGNVAIEQPKHHRWQLDRSQIVSYGLGGFLSPEVRWWEGIEVEDRSLNFVSISPWLSLCALVCEDLAQQEPVARTVRAVGPNLLIALLMDGPQLATRWPARYATVLASDPGSSVLTVTSLGMCERSVPIGRQPLRTVALWEDAKGGKQAFDLAPGEEALVLNLLVEKIEELTADGRSDQGTAGRPVLVGAYGVR